MKLVGIIDEDFVNYKKPCMVLEFPYCNFKCDKEAGQPVCQNSELATAEVVAVNADRIIERYLSNPITHAVCLQGLEPFDSWSDVVSFISKFRCKSVDDIVIYTGYTEEESDYYISVLKDWKDIIIKFGRFIPNQKPHYDKVLGINLASDNQYARRIN